MTQPANDTLSSWPVPRLSVVVVVLGGADYIPRVLKALEGQTDVEEFEIVVPCDDRVPNPAALAKQFPRVVFFQVEGRRSYAELRAIGVRRSRGAVVALTEDHCIPQSDWAAQILRAHEAPHAAVGGAVEKLEPDTALNWALYLADYVRYQNPMPEGMTMHLTDCNVTYKRSWLTTIADVWRDEFHEPIVHAALRAAGGTLWFSPRVVVKQQRSVRLIDAIRDRYAFGRLFGGGRVASAPLMRRMVFAAAALLLPFLLIARVAGHVFRKRRSVGAFLHALPALSLLSTVWALGELVGYLTGRPGAGLRPSALKAASEGRTEERAAT